MSKPERKQVCRRRVTRGAALQAGSVGRDKGRVARLAGLAHAHFEGAAHHMAPVELHIDGVDAVLVRDEANGVLICNTQGALLTQQRQQLNHKPPIKHNAGLISDPSF